MRIGDGQREKMDIEALEKARQRGGKKGTSKVTACLVAAQWMFVSAQCFRGEGRQGKLMVGGCGEVRREEREGESGPL